MRPAFASTRQAAAFALLLLVLLLLPAIMTQSRLPSREQIYSSIWWPNGAFPYIDQQIYSEKGDIDIAFIGASHIWNGIDTPLVQEKLSEKLGRPAIVRSICWGGAGYDVLYTIARDLLQNRKVKMLVFYDSYNDLDLPNALAPHWFRWGDDASVLDGLSFRLRASYYFASVIGMPRNLLSLVRDNLPAKIDSTQKMYWEKLTHSQNISSLLGALATEESFAVTPAGDHAPFVSFDPVIGNRSSDVSVYSPSTKDAFVFGSEVPAWQLHFARKFADLGVHYHCKIVLLHIPVAAEIRDPVIHEREFWPDVLGSDVAMVGIPSAKLFSNLSDDDAYKLFGDKVHLNKNGQKYFTTIITPTLLDLYASQVTP